MPEKSSLLTDAHRVRSWGPLHHRYWDTQPFQQGGMIEETWKLGPFDLVRDYPRGGKSYGSWHLTFTLSLRRWRGPWLHVGVGSGAQNWDAEERFWEASDDA